MDDEACARRWCVNGAISVGLALFVLVSWGVLAGPATLDFIFNDSLK
jgi:hypothetical protein